MEIELTLQETKMMILLGRSLLEVIAMIYSLHWLKYLEI